MVGTRRWARPAIALAAAVLAHAGFMALLGALTEIGKAAAPSIVPTVLLQGIEERPVREAVIEPPPVAGDERPAADSGQKHRTAKPAAPEALPSIVAVPSVPGQGSPPVSGVPAATAAEAQVEAPASGKPGDAPGAGGAGTQTALPKAPDAADILEKIRAKLEACLVYPPVARLQGIEGTVQLRFSVAGDGTPTGIQVVTSSGFDVLDDAAVATLEKASPLPPVAVKIKVPVVYALE